MCSSMNLSFCFNYRWTWYIAILQNVQLKVHSYNKYQQSALHNLPHVRAHVGNDLSLSKHAWYLVNKLLKLFEIFPFNKMLILQAKQFFLSLSSMCGLIYMCCFTPFLTNQVIWCQNRWMCRPYTTTIFPQKMLRKTVTGFIGYVGSSTVLMEDPTLLFLITDVHQKWCKNLSTVCFWTYSDRL